MLWAFSLVEVLVVIAIMAIIMALVVPAFRDNTSPSSSAYQFAGIFEQARSYAMANSTYVFVGLFEESGAKPPTAPGTAATEGIGRIIVAVVAAKDGTSGYDAAKKTWSDYKSGGGLLAVAKLQRFESLSIAAESLPNTTGGMVRPKIDTNGIAVTGGNVALTPFAWPLGKPLGGGQYQFVNVICFNPQGIAKIVDAQHADFTTIPTFIEIGLRQAHGNAVVSNSNIAAVQIDAITGATHVYRP